MDVNAQAVERAFRAAGVRRMIHGHTHRPGVHELEVDGARVERIVLGAWYEQGSYLSCERGSFELRTLSRQRL
jgi:UDP-2,3-diacylglucosamine hydrolase